MGCWQWGLRHVCHDKRMSGVGVRAEADHEGMRKHFSVIFCYLHRILVVFGKMVDVD